MGLYRNSTVLIFVAGLVAFFLAGWKVLIALLAGWAIGVVNFTLLTWLTRKLVAKEGRPLILLLWLVKFGLLVFLLWLSIVYFRMNPLALTAGLTFHLIAVIYNYCNSVNGRKIGDAEI